MLQGDGLRPLPHPAADRASRRRRPLTSPARPRCSRRDSQEQLPPGARSPSHPSPRPRRPALRTRAWDQVGRACQSAPGSHRPRPLHASAGARPASPAPTCPHFGVGRAKPCGESQSLSGERPVVPLRGLSSVAAGERAAFAWVLSARSQRSRSCPKSVAERGRTPAGKHPASPSRRGKRAPTSPAPDCDFP